MARLSLKRKKLLMYKDGVPGGKGCLNSLLTFVFTVSLLAFIAVTLLYFLAAVLWPILYLILTIVTFGLILLSSETSIDPTGFMESLEPVIIWALVICVIAFVLKFLIDWFYILNESRKLNKEPEKNKHYIAIAKVVKKLKIAGILVFALQIGAVIIAILITNSANFDSENVNAGIQAVSWLLFAIFFTAPVAGRIFARNQFNKINADVQAVITERNTIKLV